MIDFSSAFVIYAYMCKSFYVISCECQSAGFGEIKKKTGTNTTIITVAITDITTIFALRSSSFFFFFFSFYNFQQISATDDVSYPFYRLFYAFNLVASVCVGVCVCYVVFVRRIQYNRDKSRRAFRR